MKISFQIDGGFAYIPAPARTVYLDTEQMELQVANQLRSSIQQARFFQRPFRDTPVNKGAADYRTYTLSIEDGEQKRTIQLTDPITDPDLQNLVSQIKQLSRTNGK